MTTASFFFESFRDLTLRANLYSERYGEAGISRDDCNWLGHLVDADLFKIGPLQYQAFRMIYLDEDGIGEPFMEFDPTYKRILPPGSPVINCHIQKGANLEDREITKSLEDAETFFETHFQEARFQAFLCYSWLLYPKMTAQLPENARIRHFANRFTIIGECGYTEQALENLFDQPDVKAFSHQADARLTSLQRLFVDRPDCFGYACGVIRFKELGRRGGKR